MFGPKFGIGKGGALNPPPNVLEFSEDFSYSLSDGISTLSSFTRATVATITDFEGLVKYCLSGEARFYDARRVENLLSNNSDVFTTEAVTVVDGREYRFSMEGSGSVAITGVTAGETVSGVSGQRKCSAVLVASGTTLTLTATGAVSNALLEDVTGQANQNPSDYVSNQQTYTSNVNGVRCYFYENGNTVSSGVVTSAQGAAIPNTALNGLMVEPATTNFVQESEDFSAASWVNTKTLDVANYAKSPSGQDDATRLIDDNAGGSGFLNIRESSITVTADVPNTFSVYLKKDQLTWAVLESGAFTSGNGFTYFDLDNGVIGTKDVNHDAYTMQDVGDGWYRCSITWTTTAPDVTGNVRIHLADGDGDRSSVDQDGTSSILMWGAQVEWLKWPTTYIRTTGIAQTRDKDDPLYTITGDFSKGGTVIVEFALFGAATGWNSEGTDFLEVIHINNPGTSEDARIPLRPDVNSEQIRFKVDSPSGGTNWNTFDNLDDFTLYKSGCAWRTTGGWHYVNGVLKQDESAAAAITGCTDVHIGTFGGNRQLSGTIKNVKIYSNRLSRDEVIALTT